MLNRMGQLGLISLGLGLIGTRFIFVVDGGERALIFNKISGIQKTVYGEGMHFKVPLLMAPRFMEVRTRPRMINSITGTRDMQ